MNINSIFGWVPQWPRRLAPSLYDVVPHADALPRSLPRVEFVPASSIDGTVRHPSYTTTDFLPVGPLRTRHWQDQWLRILDAYENLVNLPPVHSLKVGAQYFVVDGHKRVAAARRTGAAVDAIVVELRPPAPPVANAA
jgi:hypothetical protein